MKFNVFIQIEAGSNQRHFHNEKTLEWKGTVEVSRRYPFPYGFVIGTTSADGGNLDCFVITKKPLQAGQIVECEAIGLMEQFEDKELDHKVLARLLSDEIEIDSNVRETLTEFTYRLFEHFEGTQVRVGKFLEGEHAEALIVACRDNA